MGLPFAVHACSVVVEQCSRTASVVARLLLLLLVGAAMACGGQAREDGELRAATPGAERPNMVLIIADDMSWDDVGAYGHPTIRTPHLDRLAREGMRFDQAFVTISSCSPSRASIITGRYPHNTGAEQLHWPLPADQVTFVEALRDAGYWTAAAGKWHMGDAIRDRFDLVLDAARLAAASQTMPGGGDLSGAEEWIETLRGRPRDQPFFLWFAAFDPHRDYTEGAIERPHRRDEIVVPPYLPDVPEVRDDLALYYDEVTRLDDYVGQVMDELGRQGVAENTLVLFISDNGRPFPRDKTTLYDSGIRTPWIVYWPAGLPGGRTSASLVSTVDIAPTFLELAGLEPLASFSGRSFLPILKDPDARIRSHVFAERNWHDFDDRSRAVRDNRYKYIRNDYTDIRNQPPADAVRSPTFQAMRRLRDAGSLSPEASRMFAVPRPAEELFLVAEDPHELRNLVLDPRHASALHELRRVLTAWQEETGDNAPEARTPDGFHPETGDVIPGRARPIR
jgi:N-sulfoglucosamine sulfohydrolase